METTNQDTIDLVAMFKTLWDRRKVFYWVWPITFVVSAALILCVPKRYTCEVILAPESQNAGGGSLQSLASSFGFNMNGMTGTDALYPQIYPDIVSSPNFLVELFDTQVTTADGEYNGTYYNYVRTKNKKPFWTRWIGKLKGLIAPRSEMPVIKSSNKKGIDVFCMSKMQWGVIGYMQDNITCNINKKTDIITLSVTAQDQLVCATMADSVCAALQSFITDYRTAKCRVDLLYYESIMDSAYLEYQKASDRYIRYADSHSGIQLEQYRIKAKNLETEMQLKESAYTSIQKQYLTTQARLQENTPVYTIIQSASVPTQAAGPRRTFFVLAMLFLATIVAYCIICREQLMAIILSGN